MQVEPASKDSPFRSLAVIRDRLPVVTLASGEDLRDRINAQWRNDPRAIGVGVEVHELDGVGKLQAELQHLDAPDGGTLLGLRIHSPEAVGLRLGLRIERVPPEVSFAFAGPDDTELVVPPVSGAAVTKLIEANRAAGDRSDGGRTYWSPMLDGDDAVILIHVPEGVDPGDVRFSIPRISYIFRDPLSGPSGARLQSSAVTQSSAYCNLDASCYPLWSDEGSAVAHMRYTKDGASYICTGTLLNDTDSSGFVPYLLTANHCISTQTAASTLETHWYWQSAACDSLFQDERYTVGYGGARLLYASGETDTAFLRLFQDPPGMTYYLGWSTIDPIVYDDVTGIHHPDGDWKKISFGSFIGFRDCWSTGGDGFECSQASSWSGTYLDVDWYAGTTEGGSSGSALLNQAGQVIGQLRGGNASCYNPDGSSYYGRFSVAYEDALKQWLNCGTEEDLFCDVLLGFWAWPHIQAIAEAGITSGCGPTSYCPDDAVTRAQMAVFLLRGLYGGSYDPPAATGRVFYDVPIDYWAAPWIERFALEGITCGCDVNRYCPDADVTRAQMAVFLLRAKYGSSYKPPPATGIWFYDVPARFWASSWIEQLAAEGITGGCGGGAFCPNDGVTRAEMAVFIAKTFGLALPPRP
jgi:hypothetical protein